MIHTETEMKYTQEHSEYYKNNPTWDVEHSPWKAKQILKLMKRNSINPRSVAEVGCGAGEILNQLYDAMPKDVEFTGFDVSPDAIALAKTRQKERLVFRLENFLEAPEFFDLLLMIDVFEHVDDYLGFLRASKRKAKNTIFHIPLDLSAQTVVSNSLIHTRKKVGHLHHFTKETALATLADSGYEVIDFFYTAGSLELPQKALKTKLAALPRRLAFSINQDWAAKLLGGFSLLVLCR